LIENGLIVPVDNVQSDLERPIITGSSCSQFYQPSTDPRVTVIVSELQQLASATPTLFRMIEEVSLAEFECVSVRIAGLQSKIKVRAEHFNDDVFRCADFLSHFNIELATVREFDSRYDNVIICSVEK
jgi:hypothetical protein